VLGRRSLISASIDLRVNVKILFYLLRLMQWDLEERERGSRSLLRREAEEEEGLLGLGLGF